MLHHFVGESRRYPELRDALEAESVLVKPCCRLLIGQLDRDESKLALHCVLRFLLPDISLNNERHAIADVYLPAGASWDHRHRKGRVRLPHLLSQCG